MREKRMTGSLNLAAIAALPTFPYRRNGDGNSGGKENNGSSALECSICLSAVEEGEMLKLLPNCKHSFHSDCVGPWLQGHTTCPVCRVDVLRPTRVAREPTQADMAIVQVTDLERQL